MSAISHGLKGVNDDPVKFNIITSEAFVDDPLHWSVMALTTNPDVPGVWDKSLLLELLDQHLAKTTAEDRARIDETLLRKISELAALNELLVLVRSHRPRVVAQDISSLSIADHGLAWRFMSKTKTVREVGLLGSAIDSQRTIQEIPLKYGDLSTILASFLSVESSDDVPDHGWLIKDIAERRALRRFWYMYRQQHKNQLKEVGICPTDIMNDMMLISAALNPMFHARLEAERKDFLAATISHPKKGPQNWPRQAIYNTSAPSNAHSQGIIEPASTSVKSKSTRQAKVGINPTTATGYTPTEWGSSPTKYKPNATTKIKTKTRGDATSIDEALADLDIADSADTAVEKVLVKDSTSKIISSLFVGRRLAKGNIWASLSTRWPM